MLSQAHQQNPYLTEGVRVVHSLIPGVLMIPSAGTTTGADNRTAVPIQVCKDRYVRTVEVNLSRIGKPPEMPAAAQALPGETLVSSTLIMIDPMLDPNEQPVYSLTGVVVYASGYAPPSTVDYPASPLQQAAAPVLQGGLAILK